MAMLAGRHAVVTGGGRGIGLAIAAALTAAGASVSIIGRSQESLRDAVRSGAAQRHAMADVRDPDALAAAFRGFGGACDIAVANAGGVETAPFARARAGLFQDMFDLNVMSVVHLFQLALPGMIERRAGRLIAVASTAGHRGYPYVSAYCAAKHAVVGLVRSLAREAGEAGVTVNAVSPGYTETDLVAGSVERIAGRTGRDPAAVRAGLVADNPLGRLVRPEQVAASVVHLCSDGGAAINGQSLLINGGEF